MTPPIRLVQLYVVETGREWVNREVIRDVLIKLLLRLPSLVVAIHVKAIPFWGLKLVTLIQRILSYCTMRLSLLIIVLLINYGGIRDNM